MIICAFERSVNPPTYRFESQNGGVGCLIRNLLVAVLCAAVVYVITFAVFKRTGMSDLSAENASLDLAVIGGIVLLMTGRRRELLTLYYFLNIRGYRIRYWTLYLGEWNDWYANVVEHADDPSSSGHHDRVTSSLCLEFMLGGWFRRGQGRILVRDKEVINTVLGHWSVSHVSGRVDPVVALCDTRTNERIHLPVTTAIRFLNGPAQEGKGLNEISSVLQTISKPIEQEVA